RVDDPKPGAPANPDADKARADVEKIQVALKMKLAEVHQLEAQLREALERTKKAGPGAVLEGGVRGWKIESGDKRVIILGDRRTETKPGTRPGKGTRYEPVPGEKGTLILRPVAQQGTTPKIDNLPHLPGTRTGDEPRVILVPKTVPVPVVPALPPGAVKPA